MVKVYRHTDGRRIEVFDTYKVRYSSKPYARSHAPPGDNSDEWPILYRSDVPNLTEAEWFASPGEGWEEQS